MPTYDLTNGSIELGSTRGDLEDAALGMEREELFDLEEEKGGATKYYRKYGETLLRLRDAVSIDNVEVFGVAGRLHAMLDDRNVVRLIAWESSDGALDGERVDAITDALTIEFGSRPKRTEQKGVESLQWNGYSNRCLVSISPAGKGRRIEVVELPQ